MEMLKWLIPSFLFSDGFLNSRMLFEETLLCLLMTSKLVSSTLVLDSIQVPVSSEVLQGVLRCNIRHLVGVTHGDPDLQVVTNLFRSTHESLSLTLYGLSDEIACGDMDPLFESMNALDGIIVISDGMSSQCFVASLCGIETSGFWNVRGVFLVVIVSQSPRDTRDVELMLENCWSKHRILNLVVLQLHLPEAKDVIGTVSTFNPFLGTAGMHHRLLKLLSEGIQDLCPDKLLDVHGHLMKVSMKHHPPSCFLVNVMGEKIRYEGPEGFTVGTMMSRINATLAISPPVFNRHGWVFPYDMLDVSQDPAKHFDDGVSDFDGNARGMAFSKLNAMAYPHDMTCYTGLVPKAGQMPGYMNFVLPFTSGTWKLYFLTIVVVNLIWRLMKRFDVHGPRLLSHRSSTLDCLRLMLLGSTESTLYSDSWRLYLASCLWFVLTINNAYQGSLTSYLTIPNYYPDINTIQDWMDSDLKIAVLLSSSVTNKIQARMHKVYPSMISQNATNRVIIMPDDMSVVNMIAFQKNLSFLTNVQTGAYQLTQREFFDVDGVSLLHLMAECVFVSPMVFRFPERSPFSGRFNTFILWFGEFGLMKKWRDDVSYLLWLQEFRRGIRKSLLKPLGLAHLQLPFYLGGLGLILSVVCFVFELLYFTTFNS